MGLLRILTRRSGKDKVDEGHLQVHTSHQRLRSASVNASVPPSPSAKLRSKSSAASLNRAGEADMWKVLPQQPNFRPVIANTTNDRPGSADSYGSGFSGRSGGSDRAKTQKPKREPRRPPVSFRKPSTLSLTHTAAAQNAATQRRGSATDADALRATSERSGSVTSLTRRMSVDLLDAVDEFRPLDFRSRVQAAGARDYAEDVADRNIQTSATPHTSTSTPDLYSQYTAGIARSASSSRSGHLRAHSQTKSVYTLDYQHDFATRKMSAPAIFEDPVSFSGRNKMGLCLDTYKPSGLVSPTPSSPHSAPLAVTTPGHRGGMTPRDFEFHIIDSPEFEPQEWSRQYRMSPTGSNFSIPRSPTALRRPVPESEEPHPKAIGLAKDFVDAQEFGDDVATANRSSQRRSGAIGSQVLATTAVRVSYGTYRSSTATYRSSMASTVSSRYLSMDFQPLGCPRLQEQSSADFEEFNDTDNIPGLAGGTQSICSSRHSRSNSNASGHNHHEPRSLLTTPPGHNDLLESSNTRDWAHVTPSSESTSGSSNGVYSADTSTGRPTSRHTKSTSVDSTPRPVSSHSYLSVSHDHDHQSASGASGWSPTTTRSTNTGFNMDDYLSSDDDDSFITKKKRTPPQDGPDLLFKEGVFGVTGAALPGLLDSMMDALPPPAAPVSRFAHLARAQAQATADEDEDAFDASAPADIASLPRPLRHACSSPDYDLFGTFGRSAGRPRAKTNKMVPSWVPSEHYDDWARLVQNNKETTIMEDLQENKNTNATDNTETEQARRGQYRLSAFGTPSEQPLSDLFDNNSSHCESGLLKRPGSSSGNNNKEQQQAPKKRTSPIREEVDAGLAARLRKEAKARKREDETKAIQERKQRMTTTTTTAFGDGASDEELLARVQALLEQADRGRARIRRGVVFA